MVTKRIRSEYMKKFKDPKWETYGKCYEDLVSYRLSRRMLEQTHNPWFWDESGSDTESSGKCTPQEKTIEYRMRNEVKTQTTKETDVHEKHGAEEEREPETSHIKEQVTDVKPQEREEEKGTTFSPVGPIIPAEKYPCVQSNTKSKPRHPYKPTRTKAKHLTKDSDKDSRHPFAMYGSGERQADMASKRTHNVGPSASTKEIFESALRAKNRRDVEKQMKRMDKRRVKSAVSEKFNKSELIPDYNPWMTEYMRCFSARSQ
ncbi:centriole, cilia and spindle-associated protein [Tachysurus fulvidraco]|uniref:centriole, cilia and spindle-associated protein n=1 Tax=Tachysurus fulvidraco TaxID=1234273 RepID=UPI000F4F8FB8|nr:centriole, cilia and spindle-associated protein [Tachysurus fulvidraco]XP_027030773.1 centriole, cilia and spindle-associated protein [Tachysurus fulvidraco]XP_027030774.1 centriole, cilia and spindle-associated protein [Tachysurus fulvidraco]XP_027030775.1 centriole, cilia and spindle-associated protein [Tachysurus fulvidraco]XP_027030776.1 centriole, cilia and spindle-associated protein [Tachysurus fulvidraco]